MKITEKLSKPLEEAKYLVEENAPRYRVIIRFFYIKYEKRTYWLTQKQVYEEIIQHSEFEDYTEDLCRRDLDQLERWNNLISQQDTAKVYTLEDFNKRKFRYQLSQYSVEIERMTIKLENLFVEGASLEPTLLERFKNELLKIHEISLADETTIYGWWDLINNDFVRLNQNYQDYISELNSAKAEEMMKTVEFVLFKEKLVNYLRTFIRNLQKTTSAIESILKKVDNQAIETIIAAVISHEKSVPRLDWNMDDNEIADVIWGRWESIVNWFVPYDGEESESMKTLDATVDIIRKITRYASQITELHHFGINRKEEYRKLCEIFLSCTSIEQAHKMSSMVFGVEKPIKLKGDYYRTTDSIYSGVYDEPPFEVPVQPRVRAYRQTTRRSGIKDYKEEKKRLLEELLINARAEQKLLESYIEDDSLDFATLPLLEPETRNILLIWLAKGLESPEGAKTEFGGLFTIDRSRTDETCVLKCSDGEFHMPHYRIIFRKE